MAAIISTIGGKQFEWRFDDDGSVFLAGQKVAVEVQRISKHGLSILFDGKSYHAVVNRNDLKYDVLISGNSYAVASEDSTKRFVSQLLSGSRHRSSIMEVRSPMPGMVVRCEVREGSPVKVGDGLFILEAMKMENEIRANNEGVVKKIHVADRQVVEKGELLMIIE
jgi:biotin carboxyl carrier protein